MEDFVLWVAATVGLCILAISLEMIYVRHKLNKKIRKRYEEDIVDRIREKFRNPSRELLPSTKIRVTVDPKDPLKVKLQYQNIGEKGWKDVPKRYRSP